MIREPPSSPGSPTFFPCLLFGCFDLVVSPRFLQRAHSFLRPRIGTGTNDSVLYKGLGALTPSSQLVAFFWVAHFLGGRSFDKSGWPGVSRFWRHYSIFLPYHVPSGLPFFNRYAVISHAWWELRCCAPLLAPVPRLLRIPCRVLPPLTSCLLRL